MYFQVNLINILRNNFLPRYNKLLEESVGGLAIKLTE